jgi:hypothetical protein
VRLSDWRGYRYRAQYGHRNQDLRKVALGHWRRTVWAALRTTSLPIEVIVTHVLPRLHATYYCDVQFLGQLDLERAASVLRIRLPDSDDTASEASSVCKDDPDSDSGYVDSDCNENPPSQYTASSSEDDGSADSAEDQSESASDDTGSPDAKRVKVPECAPQ